MSDDFFDDLRNDWRDQDTEVQVIHERLRRWRWLPHVTLAFETLSGMVVIAAGVWFAVQAAAQKDLLLAVSAVAALGVMPVAVIVLWRTRAPSLKWQDETPEGVLQYALLRLQVAGRAVRLGRWSVYVLLALVVVLWAAALAGLTPVSSFLIFITTVWLASALAGWLWLGFRTGRIAAETARCERLWEEYRG